MTTFHLVVQMNEGQSINELQSVIIMQIVAYIFGLFFTFCVYFVRDIEGLEGFF